MPRQRGVDLKALTAVATLALRHLGDQEHWLEANRYGLQLTKASSFPTYLAAMAPGTNQPLWLEQEKESNTPVRILGTPILIAFANAKCMVQQALNHPRILPRKFLSRQELFG